MKVGIYTGNYDPMIGGGFTFEDSIMRAVLEGKSKHDFYVISKKRIESGNCPVKIIHFKETPYWQARRILRGILDRSCQFLTGRYLIPGKTLLDQIIKDNKIEMVWFLTPTFEPTSASYIFTVWDLEHRIHPFFPEVSKFGWSWENRENHYKSVIPKASIILTGTEAGKKEVIKYYQVPEDNVAIVPLPTPSLTSEGDLSDKPECLKKYKIKEKYLFYPAQFWPHKNHIVILLSLRKLLDKGIKISVVFTGSDQGNLSYIKEKVKELKLDQNVYFLGFVSKEELLGIYKNAFALVFPTFFGPDNLPPLEAFALGCPVLASDVRGSVEQLGDAAILFDPKDEFAIVMAVEKLLKEPGFRKALIAKGYKKAEQWNGKKYVERVSTLISDFESFRRCWPK